MNKQQRNQWDKMMDSILKTDDIVFDDALFLVVNAYILKLERELQNIKQGKKIAAILKAKVVS